jgi:hypothetical protein
MNWYLVLLLFHIVSAIVFFGASWRQIVRSVAEKSPDVRNFRHPQPGSRAHRKPDSDSGQPGRDHLRHVSGLDRWRPHLWLSARLYTELAVGQQYSAVGGPHHCAAGIRPARQALCLKLPAGLAVHIFSFFVPYANLLQKYK